MAPLLQPSRKAGWVVVLLIVLSLSSVDKAAEDHARPKAWARFSGHNGPGRWHVGLASSVGAARSGSIVRWTVRNTNSAVL